MSQNYAAGRLPLSIVPNATFRDGSAAVFRGFAETPGAGIRERRRFATTARLAIEICGGYTVQVYVHPDCGA